MPGTGEGFHLLVASKDFGRISMGTKGLDNWGKTRVITCLIRLPDSLIRITGTMDFKASLPWIWIVFFKHKLPVKTRGSMGFVLRFPENDMEKTDFRFST